MIRYLFNKMLLGFQRQYKYDVTYMQEILDTDLSAYLRFMGFQTMSAHAGDLPVDVLFAARLRAIIWDDCGPCTQLLVNMALEAGANPDIINATINRDMEQMPDDIKLVVAFTDYVLAHDPAADDLRQRIVANWGKQGLIALGFGISTCRVYPALKYTMGYGKACSRIQVNETSLTPNRQPPLAFGGTHA